MDCPDRRKVDGLHPKVVAGPVAEVERISEMERLGRELNLDATHWQTIFQRLGVSSLEGLSEVEREVLRIFLRRRVALGAPWRIRTVQRSRAG